MQRTLHGIGVITKLYFVIFAAFKEVNDNESHSEVIQDHRFGYHRKRIYIFLLLVNSNLHRFRDAAASMSKIDNFPYPTPISDKIWGVPFGVDPSCWCVLRVKWLG